MDTSDRRETETQLRTLNESLRTKSYICGDSLTAADVLLYHG